MNDVDMNEVAEAHQTEFVQPELKRAQEAGQATRVKATTMNTFVERLLEKKHTHTRMYTGPTRSFRASFTPLDHICHATQSVHDILDNAGMLQQGLSQKQKYMRAYIVLKCRETIDTTPRKRDQLTKAMTKSDQNAKRRRDL